MSTEPESGFVTIQQARYRYGAAGPAIVDSIDWQIPRGEIHCLIGRSGCGKTTLLKLAAGLLLPMRMAPSVGISSPAASLSSVVLPQPLRPSRQWISPRGMAQSTASTTAGALAP